LATIWDIRVTDTVIIDFSSPTGPIPWARFNADVRHDFGSVDSLSELFDLVKDHKLIVWIPADKVTLSSVQVPAGQRRHLQQILPSLLEESLAGDIEKLHFASGTVSTDGDVSVAVINRAELENYIEQLQQAGLFPNVIVPDSLALPLVRDEWTLQVDSKFSRLRTSEQSAYVLDTQNLAYLLPFFQQENNSPVSLYMPSELRDNLSVDFEHEWRGEPVDKLAKLPEASVLAMNLLQGEFKVSSGSHKLWLQWRSVIYIALIAFLIQLATVGVESWQLKQQVAYYKSEVTKVFKSTFPEVRRVVNPKAQMTQKLSELQSGQSSSGFLMLLQDIAPALQQSSSVRLTKINFEQRLGELRLEVSANDYAKLENMKDSIAKLGLMVELGSVSGNKGAYTARLTIRGNK
jgi:general secretion pathway protein L